MSALFSKDLRYRYRLGRTWAEPNAKGLVLWVMLNPSTADEDLDDPTIRRCITFSKTWGYAGLMVGNVYGYRATMPSTLWNVYDPIGPENDRHLSNMAARASRIIVGWGNNADADRAEKVLKLLSAWGDVYCLGVNESGTPRHPLYIPVKTVPMLLRRLRV